MVEALGMMDFLLFHEVGHALDDIRDLGVGGNFEWVADAIDTVLSVRTGQSLAPILGAFYFAQNTEGSLPMCITGELTVPTICCVGHSVAVQG